MPLELSLRNALRLRSHSFAAQTSVTSVAARSLLDHVEAGLREGSGAAEEAMLELFSGLYSLKSSMMPEAWESIVAQCVAHPVAGLIHQDPFTARSFYKPRGYAGDAVLIDYIYTENPRIAGNQAISALGETIFRFTTAAPASAGVRARRDIMACIIDESCAVVDRPHILSVACGHLREATLCRSVLSGHVGRFVALDQDQLSLDVVKDATADRGVIPVCSSIKSLFRGDIAQERFDLIYSTGLYDYLDDRIAGKLTCRLFDMLNPGGRLVIANFLPDIWCAAFMETFMGWKLVYRDSSQIHALANEVPDEQVASRRTFIEKNANIVVLDLIRQ